MLLGQPPTLAGQPEVLGRDVEPFLPAGLRPHGLCQPGFQVVPQKPQAPEVADKAGLRPFKELWFEESRCPGARLGGQDPAGL